MKNLSEYLSRFVAMLVLVLVLSFCAWPAWGALTPNCLKNIELVDSALAPYTEFAELKSQGIADKVLHGAWIAREFSEVIKLSCDLSQPDDANRLAEWESVLQQWIDFCKSDANGDPCTPEPLPAARGYRRPSLIRGSAGAGGRVGTGSKSGTGSSGQRQSAYGGPGEVANAEEAKAMIEQQLQAAKTNQQRADQERQGKRKRHDPAAEAHECIAIDPTPSGNFGAFINRCGYKVNFVTCNYRPRNTQGGFNWADSANCEKNGIGLHTPGAGASVAAHNRGTEEVYWFACKAPAFPTDARFVAGSGITARCY